MARSRKHCFEASLTNTPKEDSSEIDELRTFEGLTLYVLIRTQIDEYLLRSEISLSNINSSRAEYKHNFIYFEFKAWPNEDLAENEVIKLLVSSIGSSAACLVLYEVMQNSSLGSKHF